MKISEISIRRPVTTLMMVFMILILGFVSFTRLNVDLLPNINLPIAVVSTGYPGAGPQEVEAIITRNLENVLATVSHVKSIRSVSSEGSSLVILEFTSGTNMDFATLEMREKIDMIRQMLPEGVSSPMVLKLDPNMMPIMSFGISQEGQDVGRLMLWIEDVVRPRLERLDGVASVSISGGYQQEIQVIADPGRLAAGGLTLMQLVNAIRMENINLPGGIIGDGKYDLLIRTTGEFSSIDDIKNIPVMNQAGTLFLLKDLAQIREDVQDTQRYSRINGQDSLTLSVQKESTANTVRVAERVNREIRAIARSHGGIEMVTILDQSEFINSSIASVGRNAILGGILAVIVLLMFLKNISPTLVIGASIPISVVATFIMVFFANVTLNMISLGGLALGVGMLVDNSIVVLENIYRLRQEGKDRIEAARLGSGQVSMAIVASTLTSICVFLPIVFTQGIAAQIFQEMALTVTFSLLASLLIALTLVPMLASKLIRNENFGKKNKTLDAVGNGYRHVLSWALGHRKIILLVTLLAFSGSLFALPRIGTEFMPASDQGQINVSIRMPRGTRFTETAAAVAQVEAIAAAIPEATAVSASVGGGQMRIGASPSRDRGSVTLVLKSLSERSRSTEEIGDDLRERLRIPGAEIRIDTGGMMFGGGGMSSAPIAIDIQGENIEILKSIAAHVLETVASVPGTREAALNYEEGAPELRILPDRQKAAQFGLNTAQISSAVQAALQGTVASRYKVDGRELDIRVMVPNRSQKTINDIESIMLASPLGTLVPLYAVADFEYASGPVQINRTDQARVLTVTSAIRGRALGSVVQDIQDRMADYPLPEGYTLFYGGENQQLIETFEDLILAMILGVVLVYMVMAAQFESLVHPFVIMAAVPLGFTGAFTGLLLAKVSLSVPAVLGMIVLAGIVVNNGIVLVDYINILRREGGSSRRDSILQAGTTRLRPILMTTMTTVLALLPLALGIGEGAELQLPLAVSIIGGLTMSTLLTLVIVPVLYTLTDDFGIWVKKRLKRHGGGAV